uniref:Uncharacterized protein n=1 Tax=Onchocerca volvulus TaxID=6282 RepID=A0A8R1Y5W1_ONCVO
MCCLLITLWLNRTAIRQNRHYSLWLREEEMSVSFESYMPKGEESWLVVRELTKKLIKMHLEGKGKFVVLSNPFASIFGSINGGGRRAINQMLPAAHNNQCTVLGNEIPNSPLFHFSYFILFSFFFFFLRKINIASSERKESFISAPFSLTIVYSISNVTKINCHL